jgi:hypothetical protein
LRERDVRSKSCAEVEEIDEVAAPFVQEERWIAMLFLSIEDQPPMRMEFTGS